MERFYCLAWLPSTFLLITGFGDPCFAEERKGQLPGFMVLYELFFVGAIRERQGAALGDFSDYRPVDNAQLAL